MNIDANTQERDEFDGDPLNPKHIEAVCGYLKNSPRDNLKKQALEIIEAQAAAFESTLAMNHYFQNKVYVITELLKDADYHLDELKKMKTPLHKRIVLWFKGK